MGNTKPKVLAIVGPTASGKTSLSIALAKKYNGEVISADSRQVYTGMDIGSGKVTPEEMGSIPHHLLDVADPMDIYNASDFKRDGSRALSEILENNHLPIIAGGTFFYVDMLLGRTSSPEVPPNQTLRSALEQLPSEVLYEKLLKIDPERAEVMDPKNARRLVRALEIVDAIGKVPKVETVETYNVLTLGISMPKEQLHHNIHVRLHQRLDEGMQAEAEALLAQGVTHERLEDLGLEYRYLSRYLRGELTYEEMTKQLETKTRQFAKRQMTWLKKDPTIVWVEKNDLEHVFKVVTHWLTQTV